MTEMFDLVLATHNRGKLEELRALLPAGLRIGAAGDIGLEAPDETGATIEENAQLKALHVSRRTPALALADDSGLEIDALEGRPGVDSASYAGRDHDDAANIERVLGELAGVPHENRGARFVCSIVVAQAGTPLAFSRGECPGWIIDAPRGGGGFGYDPIFELPDGRTMAELTSAEKNAVSHRARAVRAILPRLAELLNERRSE